MKVSVRVATTDFLRTSAGSRVVARMKSALRSNRPSRLLLVLASLPLLAPACDSGPLDPGDTPDPGAGGGDPGAPDPSSRTADDWGWMAPDVRQALEALPRAEVAAQGHQGFPAFIRGDLGQVGPGASGRTLTEADLRPVLDAIAPVFRLTGNDFALVQIERDDLGMSHAQYRQMAHGMPVRGGDLRIHVSAVGQAYAANGTAHGSLDLPPPIPLITEEAARQAALAFEKGSGLVADAPTLRYAIVNRDGSLHLTWEVPVRGLAPDGIPLHDLVQVDALDGQIVDNTARVHRAKFRQMYDGENGPALPGNFLFDETANPAEWSDAFPVFDNFNLLGEVYDFYNSVFRRDSYDHAGRNIRSSVNVVLTIDGHQIYNNAFWYGFFDQLVFAPGDNVYWDNPAVSMDIVAHELTHAVTDHESNLDYEHESGALNEAMSDIFAAVVDEWRRGVVDANTWKMGEDIHTPSTEGDAIRYMNNPTEDGFSRDHYQERRYAEPCTPSSMNDYCGVHHNSGIANMAFYLLVSGGTHRDVSVTGQGMAKARNIFYRTNTMYLTSQSTFSVMRAATMQAARDLYDTATATQVERAWLAVGVWAPPSNDNLANATNVAALPFSYVGSTYLASLEPGESGRAASVWFKWTPAVSGVVDWLAEGYLETPTMGLFVGSGIPALSRVDPVGPFGSTTFGVVAGTTYRVQIANSPNVAEQFLVDAAYSDAAVVYLSDIPWKSATNGHGPVERDRSNNGSAAGDGKTLTLAGVTYSKGLGANSTSDIRYTLAGQYVRFLAKVGVDDEVGTSGSVEFEVYADGTKIYDSGAMNGSSATKTIDVNVTARNELRLLLTNGGSASTSDHGDWADARLIRASVTDTAVPARPTNLRQGGKTHDTISLAFDVPGNESSDVMYQIMRGTTHVATGRYWVDVHGLSPSTAYTFTARAIDPAGNISGPSNNVTITTSAAPAGTGLRGNYYNGKQFGGFPVLRDDGTVNFDWSTGSPISGVSSDNFSVRWTGYVVPAHSQTYTFYTSTSDGVRLWVDGRLIIDRWVNQGTTETSGTIALQANRRYEIRMEMYENTGSAVAKLSWSSSSQAKQIIPKSRLFNW